METKTRKYRVNYIVNTFDLHQGIPNFQPEKKCELEAETDDLHYLFKDIAELHHGDKVVGLKIIAVKEL